MESRDSTQFSISADDFSFSSCELVLGHILLCRRVYWNTATSSSFASMLNPKCMIYLRSQKYDLTCLACLVTTLFC